MTKLRINSGIFIVSFLLLTLAAACKKDDPVKSFTLIGPTALHFVYGQEKEVGFSRSNVGNIAVTESPDGWECKIVGSNVVITAPASASQGAEDGSIKLTASGSTITRTISVAIKLAQEITDISNCFIVTQPDTRYKFNATRKGNQNTASLSPKDAVLAWSTVKGGVSHVSLEDGYIYFTTSNEATELTEGNAVIAAMDGKENVVWSWHIWMTDYDPASNPHQLAGMQVMNRNLGAFTLSHDSTEDVLRSYGLYYQWGRKDPFVGPNAWDGTSQHAMYNAGSKWINIAFEKSDAKTGTIEYAIAHPGNYIVGVENSHYDWLFAKRENDLWGGVSGNKTIYDPCPAGWKVAPPSIWASFTTTGRVSDEPSEFVVDGNYEYGWTFYDQNSEPVYYPAGGRRSFVKDSNNFTNVVDLGFGESGPPVGFYWSNSHISDNESALLAFTEDYINPGTAYNITPRTRAEDEDPSRSAEGARAGGFPLRCVAE